MTNLTTHAGLAEVAAFIEKRGMLVGGRVLAGLACAGLLSHVRLEPQQHAAPFTPATQTAKMNTREMLFNHREMP